MQYADAKLILSNATTAVDSGHNVSYATECAIDTIQHNLAISLGTDEWSETELRDIRNLLSLYRHVQDKARGLHEMHNYR